MENTFNEIISKYNRVRNKEKAFIFFRDGAFAAKKIVQEKDEKQIIFVRSTEFVCSEEDFKAEKAKWAENIKAYNEALDNFKKKHADWFDTNMVFKTLKTPIEIAEDVSIMSSSLRDTAKLIEAYNVWQDMEKKAEELKNMLIESDEYKTPHMRIKDEYKKRYDAEVQKLKDLYSFLTDKDIKNALPCNIEQTKYTKRRKFNFEDLK